MSMEHCLADDIKDIATRLGADAEKFAGQTILLCGGAGFLGRYFTSAFLYINAHVLRTPCRVIVCDNLITSGALGLQQEDDLPNVRFLKHDIIQPLHLDEPVDYVIQAAGIASPYYYRKYPLETLEVATLGTKQVLTMSRAHRLKGFLFFSSSEIYGDPDPACVPTPETYRGNVACLGPRACYDESKRVGETLCMIFHERHSVPTRMVRPFNVYGPGMQETDYRVLPNFASRILTDQPLLLYGTGTQTRTFCYISDAIVGFLKVLLHGRGGEAYNIGNPTPEISMLELARTLEKVLSRSLSVEVVDHPSSYPADEPQRRCPDISKAIREVGYQPVIALEEGLKRFMGWARTHYTKGESALRMGDRPARARA